jgi:hypothetical protein
VIRGPGYRFRGPGSIPGATRFSEKQWVWNGVHPASWAQLRSCLKEKLAAPVYKTEIMACRRNSSRLLRGTLYPRKLALTSPTSGDRSVGVFHSRTQTTEFFFYRIWSERAQSTTLFSPVHSTTEENQSNSQDCCDPETLQVCMRLKMSSPLFFHVTIVDL